MEQDFVTGNPSTYSAGQVTQQERPEYLITSQ